MWKKFLVNLVEPFLRRIGSFAAGAAVTAKAIEPTDVETVTVAVVAVAGLAVDGVLSYIERKVRK